MTDRGRSAQRQFAGDCRRSRERSHRADRPSLDRRRPCLGAPVRARRVRRRHGGADHRQRSRRPRCGIHDPRARLAPFHRTATGLGTRARSCSGCGRPWSARAFAGRSPAQARGMGVAGTASRCSSAGRTAAHAGRSTTGHGARCSTRPSSFWGWSRSAVPSRPSPRQRRATPHLVAARISSMATVST